MSFKSWLKRNRVARKVYHALHISNVVNALFDRTPDKETSEENRLNVYRYCYYDEVTPGVYNTSPEFKVENVIINEDETALIVIDPWKESQFKEIDEAVEKNVDEYLLTIVDKAIEKNMKCIIFTNSPKYSPSEIVDSLVERVNEGKAELKYYDDFAGADEFGKYLHKNNILNLIYTGYSIDQCVCFRSTGIIPMRLSRYSNSFKFFIIPEATLSYVSENEGYNNQMRENICIMLSENEIARLISYKDYMAYWD